MVVKGPESSSFTGNRVLKETVETLAAALCLVYADKQECFRTNERVVQDKEASLVDPRNAAWLSETSPKVSLALQNLLPLVSDDSTDVRLSLLSFARKLVASSSRYVHPSINQSINRVNPSINQSINLSINQSINQSIHPSINQSINQSINRSSILMWMSFAKPINFNTLALDTQIILVLNSFLYLNRVYDLCDLSVETCVLE